MLVARESLNDGNSNLDLCVSIETPFLTTGANLFFNTTAAAVYNLPFRMLVISCTAIFLDMRKMRAKKLQNHV